MFHALTNTRSMAHLLQLTSPLVDGRLKNWDALEQVWSHAFKDCLRADMKVGIQRHHWS